MMMRRKLCTAQVSIAAERVKLTAGFAELAVGLEQLEGLADRQQALETRTVQMDEKVG